jgi:ankyrin repeat protein
LAAVLLARKADAKAENNKGDTPLHEAAGSSSRNVEGLLGVAQLLLKNGAEVDAKNNSLRTPLMTDEAYGFAYGKINIW